MKYKNRIIALLISPLLLSVAACDSTAIDENIDNPSSSQENTVTISIKFDEASVGTRDGEGDGSSQTAITDISKGDYIDELILAFYEEKDGEYEIVEEFGEENPESKGLTKGQRKYPVTGLKVAEPIRLVINPDKIYYIACWAQKKGNKYYDTEDLTAIQVNYAGEDGSSKLNNDEERDAFFGNAKLTARTNIEVVLHRPFAQINVGTTGADFRNLAKGANIYPNAIITESQIEIKRAANTLNALNGSASYEKPENGSEELTVTYDWNKLPAYIASSTLPSGDNVWDGNFSNEKFLSVKLNNDDSEGLRYKTSYPTKDNEGKYLTEKFKYLSMCYVLVPSSTDNGSTVDLTISLRENESGKYLNPISLLSVPVKANYRTNIIGGLYWMKDPDPKNQDPNYPPTDPDDPDNPDNPTPTPPVGPDDPTSIFNFTSFTIKLSPFDWHHFEYIPTGQNSETTDPD